MTTEMMLAICLVFFGCGQDPEMETDAGTDAAPAESFTLRGRMAISWQCWSASREPGTFISADEIVIDPFDGTFALDGRFCSSCPITGELRITGACATLQFATPLGDDPVVSATICDTLAGSIGRLETAAYTMTFTAIGASAAQRETCEF